MFVSARRFRFGAARFSARSNSPPGRILFSSFFAKPVSVRPCDVLNRVDVRSLKFQESVGVDTGYWCLEGAIPDMPGDVSARVHDLPHLLGCFTRAYPSYPDGTKPGDRVYQGRYPTLKSFVKFFACPPVPVRCWENLSRHCFDSK